MRVHLAIALLCLATAAHAESTLRGIVVSLRAKGDRVSFLLERDDDLGIARAHAFFRKHFPQGHERQNCWVVLALLRDPEIRALTRELLAVGGLKKANVVMELEDSTARLYRGEYVRVPLPGGRVSARFATLVDRDLGELARRLGSSTREIAEADPERFDVFPHILHDDGPRGRAVYVGENGIGRACRGDTQTARAMILHELAHVADFSKQTLDVKEAERNHRPWDVMPASKSLSEGWADYWAMRTPGIMQDFLGKEPPAKLQALGAPAMLRCSVVVGQVLTDLAALHPGRAALHEAMRSAWKTPDPTLAHVLGAYLRANPGLTMPVAESLARRTAGQGTPVDYLLLARGL